MQLLGVLAAVSVTALGLGVGTAELVWWARGARAQSVVAVEPGLAAAPRSSQVPTTLAVSPARETRGATPTPEARAMEMFSSTVPDPPPKRLEGMTEAVVGRHYYASDEWNHTRFRDSIEKLGHAYVGVGTDQNYLFIAWARPSWAWCIDYDQQIVDLHDVYRTFFAEVDRPQSFIYLWSKPGVERAVLALRRRYPSDDDFTRVRAAYRRSRARVSRRLERMRVRFAALGVPSFLTDREEYRFVRRLVDEGRVRSVRVDLNGERGLAAIGDAAREMGVPIRVLYLSNAEQYVAYSDRFRANIARLHFDDASVVLRTLSTWDHNRDYRYVVQPALRFQVKIQDSTITRVAQLVTPRTP